MSQFTLLYFELNNLIFSPDHGSNQSRAKVIINKLRRDLNTEEYSPELKQVLIDEIDRMEMYYNKYMLLDEDTKSVYMIILRSMIEKIF